jgi:hypothetical protein
MENAQYVRAVRDDGGGVADAIGLPATGGAGGKSNGANDGAPPGTGGQAGQIPTPAGGTDGRVADSRGTDLGPNPMPVDMAPATPPDLALEAAARAGSTVRHSFETDAQGWADIGLVSAGGTQTRVARSTTTFFEGKASLELPIQASTSYPSPSFGCSPAGGLPAGGLATMQVWIPASQTALLDLQVFAYYFANGSANPSTRSQLYAPANLMGGKWNTLTLRLPTGVGTRGISQLGLLVRTNGTRSFSVYVDAVAW